MTLLVAMSRVVRAESSNVDSDLVAQGEGEEKFGSVGEAVWGVIGDASRGQHAAVCWCTVGGGGSAPKHDGFEWFAIVKVLQQRYHFRLFGCDPKVVLQVTSGDGRCIGP